MKTSTNRIGVVLAALAVVLSAGCSKGSQDDAKKGEAPAAAKAAKAVEEPAAEGGPEAVEPAAAEEVPPAELTPEEQAGLEKRFQEEAARTITRETAKAEADKLLKEVEKELDDLDKELEGK
jgi:hypothetical protein